MSTLPDVPAAVKPVLPRSKRARAARERRAAKRRESLRKRAKKSDGPPTLLRVVMHRVTWQRENATAPRTRFFRWRRNAESLYAMLADDDGTEYSPIIFIRIDELIVRDFEWRVVHEEVRS